MQRIRYGLNLALLCTVLAVAPRAAADLVFSAPPRESGAKGDEVYAPLADFMSRVLGQKVVYQHSDNWLSYQSGMQRDAYDIVFDGPHFIGWRMEQLGHVPVVKLSGNLAFVVIVKTGDGRVAALKDIAGRTLCAHAPPNLATLTTLFEFDNPARQPLIVETVGFPAAYRGLLAGRCVATVLQAKLYESLDRDKAARVVFRSRPYPNQGISVGQRVSAALRDKLTQALLSPDGAAVAKGLLERFKKTEFVPATREEYQGLGRVLKDVWGFDRATRPATR
jgi:ABC-type phosphate/phosphonate transport system substrate-binding protein